jgi:tetratricopeptide (TPR) repeat protein
MELSENIYEQVEALSAEGSSLFDAARFSQAILKWKKALELLPEPQPDWDAYTWLSTSIGDAHYQLAQFDVARQFLFDALNGPDAQSNPFIHYRLGQCEIKIGNQDSAKNHLLQAYMLDGEKIFHGESDGLTYLQMLKDAKLIP